MVSNYTKLRFRRKVRARKKQVVDIGQSANKHLDRHIFRRWHNLKYAARFSIAWLGLILVLIVALTVQLRSLGKYYLVPKPVAGGVYSEGIAGTFNNANPIYAVSDTDTSVSKLVFSSLLTYDQKNNLKGSLAKSWESDDRGLTYTVKLKNNLLWHDGKELTADDVVFTFNTIQNPDVKSPYLSSWKGIKISKVDKKTVQFVLPNAYSPFPHFLTMGIIPKHLLKDVPVAELRSHAFNNKQPVGSGPFKFKSISIAENNSTIQMAAFDNYILGKPKLDGVTIKTYQDNDALKKASADHQVMVAAGLTASDQDFPSNHELYSFNLMSANMIFLKTTSTNLTSMNVRKALIHATDTNKLNSKVGYPVIAVKEPILNSQLGYNPKYQQLGYDKPQAIKLFEEAGWLINGKEHYRSKNGKPLILKLTYQANPDFSKIAQELQKQWTEVGVNLSIEVTPDNQVNRKILDSHDYDVLLYGINIGADPDVYPYWHSSQIDKKSSIHLNLSEYKSAIADASLEAGRSRQDPVIRSAKYKSFLEVWARDVPAIGLYQPRYLYVMSHEHIYGLHTQFLNSPSDRFNNVHEWMIKTRRFSQ